MVNNKILKKQLPGRPYGSIVIKYDFFENVSGAVAQLGERRVRNAEVGGSNPLDSRDCSVSAETLPDQSHPNFVRMALIHS